MTSFLLTQRYALGDSTWSLRLRWCALDDNKLDDDTFRMLLSSFWCCWVYSFWEVLLTPKNKHSRAHWALQMNLNWLAKPPSVVPLNRCAIFFWSGMSESLIVVRVSCCNCCLAYLSLIVVWLVCLLWFSGMSVSYCCLACLSLVIVWHDACLVFLIYASFSKMDESRMITKLEGPSSEDDLTNRDCVEPFNYRSARSFVIFK